MPTATVVTNYGKAVLAGRLLNTPTQAAPRYVAIGTGAGTRTAAPTDTTLTTQTARQLGTETVVTTAVVGDTYQVAVRIQLASAADISEAGLFQLAGDTPPNMFASATFNPISIATNDFVTMVWRIQVL